MKSRALKLIGIFVVVVIVIVLVRLLTNADGEVVSLGKPCTTAGEIIELQELTFECQEIESVLIWQEYSEEDQEYIKFRKLPIGRGYEDEGKLIDYFLDKGYSIMNFNKMSFIDQLSECLYATELAGINGSNVFNFCWAKPETKASIILTTNSWGYDFWYYLKHCKIDYTIIGQEESSKYPYLDNVVTNGAVMSPPPVKPAPAVRVTEAWSVLRVEAVSRATSLAFTVIPVPAPTSRVIEAPKATEPPLARPAPATTETEELTNIALVTPPALTIS